MTVINNKNISGITSINAQSNSLELFNSAGVSLLDLNTCLLYTSPSPQDVEESRMPSSA